MKLNMIGLSSDMTSGHINMNVALNEAKSHDSKKYLNDHTIATRIKLFSRRFRMPKVQVLINGYESAKVCQA